ncbi:TPA: hypothetical protein I9Z77_003125, partial [Clostridium perfringens]|nr:hypothetical protein [Clostridium perfringens]
MFRKGQEKKLKFAIKKKKGGGGAASYIIGCFFFGVVMIGSSSSINAEEIKSHNNSSLEVNNITKDTAHGLNEEIASIDSLNTEKSNRKTVDSESKKPLIRKTRAVQNDTTIVQPEQFHEYFIGDPGGSQIIPENIKNGKIILTQDKQNQVGGITLKNKIGLDEDFTWIGKVGFGNKEMINKDGNLGNTNNADGISFILHSGTPGELGAAGANMGAGGLPNVIGLKLDTYRNLAQLPNRNSNDLNMRLGWESDWTPDKPGVGKPGFGAIIKTVYTNEHGVSGWRVKQDYNSYQYLPYRPKKWLGGKNDYYPLDEGNMIISYSSSGNGILVFRYKDIVWEIPNVKKYYEDKGINAVSFSIQSSTGAFSSENSMKFENFVYKAVNGEVFINSGTKVYDGKVPDFKSATIQLFTDNGGVKEQPFEFKNSDFIFYSKDNPNEIVNPINVGEYIVKLSDSGKQRITNENLGYLGNLDAIKGKYTITPRPITVTADDITISSNEIPYYSYKISGEGIVNSDDLGIQVENSDLTNQKPGIHNGILIPKITKPNANYEVTIKNGNLTIITSKDKEKYEPNTTPIEKPYGEGTTEKEVIDHVKVPDGSNGKVTVDNPGDL